MVGQGRNSGDTITSNGLPEQAVSLVMTSQQWGRASAGAGPLPTIHRWTVICGRDLSAGAASPVRTPLDDTSGQGTFSGDPPQDSHGL